ncbi:MAG: DUF190 domain-containing protein [Candidatus Bathyarchaeota archaeon]|nr:DUF190 domain-containing protein [Candidatus Bathyarchaeota archaeon]
MKMKMWNLTIRIKKNDRIYGKRLENLVLELLHKAGIAGATVWTGVDGFGKRGKSTMHIEGITLDMPLIIEIIDLQEKLEPLLPQLKQLIGDDGIVTINETYII